MESKSTGDLYCFLNTNFSNLFVIDLIFSLLNCATLAFVPYLYTLVKVGQCTLTHHYQHSKVCKHMPEREDGREKGNI